MLRRRAAIEPTIGHLKSDNRMNRNYLTGQVGDKINAVLSAAGYNLRKLLRWLVFAPIFWLRWPADSQAGRRNRSPPRGTPDHARPIRPSSRPENHANSRRQTIYQGRLANGDSAWPRIGA